MKLKFGEDYRTIQSNIDSDVHKKVYIIINKLRRYLPTFHYTLYQYFYNFSKNEVDNVIMQLTDDEKILLVLKYGNNFINPNSNKSWKFSYEKDLSKILKKIEKFLNIKDVTEIRTFYNCFPGYSIKKIKNVIGEKISESFKAQIMEIFNCNLSSVEINILIHRYGLFGEKVKTYKELCIEHKMARKNIKAIEAEAINKLLQSHIIEQFLNGMRATIKNYHSSQSEKISIYEYFEEYSKETVDAMLSRLNEIELSLLKKKFGENLDNLVRRVNWEDGESKRYTYLYMKMKRILESPEKEPRQPKEKKERPKISIYEYFKEYSKEQVDVMLSRLNEAELTLLKKKFGENLDNLVRRVNWEDGESKRYIYLYMKMKRLLAAPLKEPKAKKERHKVIEIKNLYEYFKEYSKEQVDKAISKLSIEEKQILVLKYGGNLNSTISLASWDSKYDQKIYLIRKKITKILQGKTREKSFYEYFSGYTQEQIDKTIALLNENDKQILFLRYGEDLENPVKSQEWDYKKHSAKLSMVKKKINDILEGNRLYNQPVQTVQKSEGLIQEIEFLDAEPIVDDGNSPLERISTNPIFEQVITNLPRLEAIILELKFGMYGKYYSNKEIASLFNTTELIVIDVIRKSLIKYKRALNRVIDDTIILMEEDNLKLLLEKKTVDN